MTTRERIEQLIDAGAGAKVRTRRGGWREVVALYSDDTVLTIRAGQRADGERFTTLDIRRLVDVCAARAWIASVQSIDEHGRIGPMAGESDVVEAEGATARAMALELAAILNAHPQEECFDVTIERRN